MKLLKVIAAFTIKTARVAATFSISASGIFESLMATVRPTPEEQLAFLGHVERLLSEGQFVATPCNAYILGPTSDLEGKLAFHGQKESDRPRIPADDDADDRRSHEPCRRRFGRFTSWGR